uniref:3'-5' exonuclease n=1 Tax=Pithovirus LCPAC001 TaxID=2506585 RepID=A0A481Z1J2_9VIRU|nr:MAG: 3'-5' exonuclease [Pithovirus LCPAC001]
MDSYKTFIIESSEEFCKNFYKIKNNAITSSNPRTWTIGFDIEFISKSNSSESFKRSSEWVDNIQTGLAVCLIQIATKGVCFVINLAKMKIPLPSKLINIIKSDSWIKFGIGIENDLSILSSNYNLGHCGGGIELKNLALMSGLSNPSMKHLCKIYMSDPYHGSDRSPLCDWSQDLKTRDLLYASKDAIVSYEIGMKMMKPTLDSIVEQEQKITSKISILSTIYRGSDLKNKVSYDSGIDCIKTSLKKLNKKRVYTFKELRNILNTECTRKMEKKMLNKLLYNDFSNIIERVGDITPPIWKLKVNSNKELSNVGKIINSINPNIIERVGDITPPIRKLNVNSNKKFSSVGKIVNSIDPNINYIGKIQEYAQKKYIKLPEYTVIQDFAPFKVRCKLLNKSTIGSSGSKKKAKIFASMKMYNIVFSY